ncbi:ArsR/SmtB family transcription factor [Kineococcus sp. SYSU DK002]|uniref:ArsR/SmtB family transcription factor n=1 Tax=Kineococcus sp. SYSU DK002 TaxID=3383123 RepID=UPI003D7E21F9
MGSTQKTAGPPAPAPSSSALPTHGLATKASTDTGTGTDAGTAVQVPGPPAGIAPGKLAMYESFAAVAKTLGNPLRLMLLDLLSQAERSVEALAIATAASVGNTSAQLQALKNAGLVQGRRAGSHVFYRLTGQDIAEVLEAFMTMAQTHNPAVRQATAAYLGDVDGLRAITAEQLRADLEAGRVVLLDVRPSAEYAAGHIPTARNITPEHLGEALPQLVPQVVEQSTPTEVVAYCRGPYCAYAPQALRALDALGVHGKLLPGGIRDWRRFGLDLAGATAT